VQDDGMSDEPKKLERKRRVPWAAAVLVFATLLSYVGLIAFMWLSVHASLTLLILWGCGTALAWRLGMRALKKRYAPQ
jgi:uncharacterized membrane protein (DUF485 family)